MPWGSVLRSEISKAELLTWRERTQAEGCNVYLVGFFPAVSRKTLGNTANKHVWETFCLRVLKVILKIILKLNCPDFIVLSIAKCRDSGRVQVSLIPDVTLS